LFEVIFVLLQIVFLLLAKLLEQLSS